MDWLTDPTSRAAIELLSEYAEQSLVTQTELAERTGIDQSRISRVFAHRSILTLPHFLAICSALGLPPAAVITEAEKIGR